MKKLRLEALKVESFETDAPGGVEAMESFELIASAESGCGPCATDKETCWKTCARTCATCPYSCDLTCPGPYPPLG